MRRLASISLLFLLTACQGSGRLTRAPFPPQPDTIPASTARLTCWDAEPPHAFRSRLARSSILESPNGEHRAFVEVRAIAEEGASGHDCHNVSRLYIARRGQSRYERRLELEPDQLAGNSIALVDWSPDGRHLLLEVERWPYFSEFSNPAVALFDVETNEIELLPVERAMTRHFSSECYMAIGAVGFEDDGDVVVSLTPEGEELYGPTCADRRLLWSWDGRRDALRPLPGSFTAARYGREVTAAAS